jgi:hypothetical protein
MAPWLWPPLPGPMPRLESRVLPAHCAPAERSFSGAMENAPRARSSSAVGLGGRRPQPTIRIDPPISTIKDG